MNKTETQAAVMACMERMHRIRFWHSPNGMSPGECKLLSLICRLEETFHISFKGRETMKINSYQTGFELVRKKLESAKK